MDKPKQTTQSADTTLANQIIGVCELLKGKPDYMDHRYSGDLADRKELLDMIRHYLREDDIKHNPVARTYAEDALLERAWAKDKNRILGIAQDIILGIRS